MSSDLAIINAYRNRAVIAAGVSGTTGLTAGQTGYTMTIGNGAGTSTGTTLQATPSSNEVGYVTPNNSSLLANAIGAVGGFFSKIATGIVDLFR